MISARRSIRDCPARVSGGLLAIATTAGLLVVGAPTADADDAEPKTYTIVAHRGDRNEAPENTVSAIKTAIAKSTDAIEMDVQFSSSGYPVIMHDLTFDRTTNCTGKVLSKTRTQMKACTAGGFFSPAFETEPVPTLGRALMAIALSKTTRVILHVKITPDAKQAKRIMDEAKKYKITKRVIILASNNTTIKAMKKVGFKSFAYIFNLPSGWDRDFDIMIPYDTPLDPVKIAAVQARGDEVWPVESHPDSLQTLLLAGKVDGILANHLQSLLDLSRSSPKTIKSSKPVRSSPGARRVEEREDFSDEITAPPPPKRR